MTLLLKYFGDSNIRVTVLLKCLDRAFSICGCRLFYNSLIFVLFFFPLVGALSYA